MKTPASKSPLLWLAGLLLTVLRRFPHALLPLTLVALPQYSAAQTMRVQTVTIKSVSGGLFLSRPESVDLIVRRQGDGFYSNAERIDTGVVEALVRVLSESPIPSPQASNLGVTEAWLNENVDQAGAKSLRYRFTYTAHLDAYRNAFKNLANM